MSSGTSSCSEQLWLWAMLWASLATLPAKWLLIPPHGLWWAAPFCPAPSSASLSTLSLLGWGRTCLKAWLWRAETISWSLLCAAHLAVWAWPCFSPLSPPCVLTCSAPDGEWQVATELSVAGRKWEGSLPLMNTKYPQDHQTELTGASLKNSKKRVNFFVQQVVCQWSSLLRDVVDAISKVGFRRMRAQKRYCIQLRITPGWKWLGPLLRQVTCTYCSFSIPLLPLLEDQMLV